VVFVLLYYHHKPLDFSLVITTYLPSEINSYTSMLFRSKYIYELFWTELRYQLFEAKGNTTVS
jgi:hypothetical protein